MFTVHLITNWSTGDGICVCLMYDLIEELTAMLITVWLLQ